MALRASARRRDVRERPGAPSRIAATVSTIFPRRPLHDAARAEISRHLRTDKTKRLIAEGAAASVDDALARSLGWLPLREGRVIPAPLSRQVQP